ncbi:MAG TPA: hypothetical protein VFG87_13210 [Amycolatopsis sp.]|jgi:hypothetical protein|nr:hypothetical protein [Amycolatopsis sp.]
MDVGTTTQLITVGATLGGVVLTLVTNAMLENRRLHAAHRIESLKAATEEAKWLRDERVKAYAGLSIAGEEAFQFVRSEFADVVRSDNRDERDDIEARWRERRSELRKAYNQVALFGADEPRRHAKELWKATRNGVNDFLAGLDTSSGDSDAPVDHDGEMDEILTRIADASARFLDACRDDLQDRSPAGGSGAARLS